MPCPNKAIEWLRDMTRLHPSDSATNIIEDGRAQATIKRHKSRSKGLQVEQAIGIRKAWK